MSVTDTTISPAERLAQLRLIRSSAIGAVTFWALIAYYAAHRFDGAAAHFRADFGRPQRGIKSGGDEQRLAHRIKRRFERVV